MISDKANNIPINISCFGHHDFGFEMAIYLYNYL